MPHTTEVGQEVDIELRRRNSIDRKARTARPRLSAGLRQLGAVGKVIKPPGAGSRPAIVKTLVVSPKNTARLVHYIQHKAGHNLTNAPLFGPEAAQAQAFAHRVRLDHHQFHMIVNTGHTDVLGERRQEFIEHLVAQMERDLGKNLEWVAANHYNTPYPHTHVIIRGVANGKELYMARDYVERGIRFRVQQRLNHLLGPIHTQTQALHLSLQQSMQMAQGLRPDPHRLNGLVQGTNDPDNWQTQTRQRQTDQLRQLNQMADDVNRMRQQQHRMGH